MPQVTLYHAPRSRSLRARWLLEEIGAPYEVRLLDLGKGDHKAPGYLALNPMGKVPTVVVDGHPVWESPAIVAHLWGALTFEQIAELAGCSSSTAHRRYLAGLSALRERWGTHVRTHP